MKFRLFLYFIFPFCLCRSQNASFKKLCSEFVEGYSKLGIPETQLDYKINFQTIKNKEELKKQATFFTTYSKKINSLNRKELNKEELLHLEQLKYEVEINTERIRLEKKWNDEGRKIPEGGLHDLSNYKEWYSYYIKHFTSVNIGPEEVFQMGETEVKKVKTEIEKIRIQLGYNSETEFYKILKADSFYLNDPKIILKQYAKIDSTVRANLNSEFFETKIDEVAVMEWPDPTPSTPPGMYLRKSENPYGMDVFQYNFLNSKHNKRCMEWLYMHEAIPGHHLQSVSRRNKKVESIENQFFYFGNSEGWACYVEDHGKEFGLYKNPYTYLGKWEWDLVRSARLVMEVGIHYYGWSYDKALTYWNENIMGQDEIAEREIKRITKWAGQALCYKVGALTIQKIIALKLKKGDDLKTAHQLFLTHSDVPLQVLLEQ